MNYRFNIKKVGNHWYADLEHQSPLHVALNEKCERFLNKIDKSNCGCLEINLLEVSSVIPVNCIFFEEEDILKYFTTDDKMEIRFYIQDYELSISSDLYTTIEGILNPNFHKYLYVLDISDRTI